MAFNGDKGIIKYQYSTRQMLLETSFRRTYSYVSVSLLFLAC